MHREARTKTRTSAAATGHGRLAPEADEFVALLVYAVVLHMATVAVIKAGGHTKHWGVVVVLVLVAVAMSAWAVTTTRFFEQWIFWRPRPERPLREVVSGAVLSWFVLTLAFASVTAILAHAGAFSARGEFPGDALVTGGWFRGSLMWATELYYLWHLLDAVPGLKVPTTLHWDDPKLFSSMGAGALLLAYKVMVIGPALRVVVELFSRGSPKDE